MTYKCHSHGKCLKPLQQKHHKMLLNASRLPFTGYATLTRKISDRQLPKMQAQQQNTAAQSKPSYQPSHTGHKTKATLDCDQQPATAYHQQHTSPTLRRRQQIYQQLNRQQSVKRWKREMTMKNQANFFQKVGGNPSRTKAPAVCTCAPTDE